MERSYYQKEITVFLNEPDHVIIGELSTNHRHDLEYLQQIAWQEQIIILQKALAEVNFGKIYFEFSIPRMGKRVDNILLINDLILVLEFKVGDKNYSSQAKNQTIDYCLDLLNFHKESQNQKVIPILIATEAKDYENIFTKIVDVENCFLCNKNNLEEIIHQLISVYSSKHLLNSKKWEESIYKPTPTIIEAAQALYKGHNVQEISRNDAGAINLSKTTDVINNIINKSKLKKIKSICFLTGIPGAGKTLAGLNIASERLKTDESEHSVFLSGNGPLVDVLRQALARDTVTEGKKNKQSVTKEEALRKAKSFIQNIHHFRDDNLISEKAPIEKVVIFDEAQRAWEKEQVSKFMMNKKGIPNFEMSEPEFLISVMDRHQDWCTIVCLIGGGQEINTGEAGVSEWFISLKNKYPNWDIYFSEKILSDSTYLNEPDIKEWLIKTATAETNLHLSVSIRSFRSEKVSQLIQTILDDKPTESKELYQSIKDSYPIYLTRNLMTAKQWLKEQAKGSEHYGIIASSGARRLRSEGIDVKNKLTPADWFLNDKNDVRSSYYLEDVVTEFDIQGLEIDYSCMAWDINLLYDNGWHYRTFKGTKWQNIKKETNKKYLLNAYRVLLTRARQGMIIYVPLVDDSDWTRPKAAYDSTFAYLRACGFTCL